MAVIDVPGEELERVHDLLQRTNDLLSGAQVGGMGAQVAELGQRDLEGAAGYFEKRWTDARHLVGKDHKGVSDAAKTIADTFHDLDEQTGAVLDGNGGGQ